MGVVFKQIQPERPLEVRRVKDDHVIGALLGDERQDVVGEVTVRINHAHASACFNVLLDHLLEELRFADT